MPTFIAVLLCLAVVAAAELVRFGVARAFRLPSTRVAKLFVAPRGGSRPLRALAIFAGTVTTYLGAVALAFMFFTCTGTPTRLVECTVIEVPPGYPATGKLEKGDRIIAIDGDKLDRSPSTIIDQKGGAPVRLTIVRRGEQRDVTIQPVGHDGHWIVGFRPSLEPALVYDPGLAVRLALAFPLRRAAQLFPAARDQGAQPGGPVRITEVFHRLQLSEGERVFRLAAHFIVYILLLVIAIDLARAVRAVMSRQAAARST
jgi:hypothetical protein